MGVGSLYGAGGAGDVDALFHGAGVVGGTGVHRVLYAAARAAGGGVLGISGGGGAVFAVGAVVPAAGGVGAGGVLDSRGEFGDAAELCGGGAELYGGECSDGVAGGGADRGDRANGGAADARLAEARECGEG